MTARLRIENVGIALGGQAVLNDVSLCREKGKMTGLIGPTGAGKSTLVRIAAGLLVPDTGCALIDGIDLRRLTARARALRIAYVPQASATGFPAQVFETCLLGRTPHMRGIPSPRDCTVVEDTLNRLRLTHFAFRSVAELSGGERQRVMLARALVQETDILILDEPTSALDIGNQLSTLRILRETALEKGTTVVMALHDLALAARFCDRLLLLSHGQTYASGAWNDVLTPETIRAVYGIEAHIGAWQEYPVFIPYEGEGQPPAIDNPFEKRVTGA